MEDEQRPALFVYGTLKPGEANYKGYLAGRTAANMAGVLRGAALFTDEVYPFLVVDPAVLESDDCVRGAVLHLLPAHYVETLRRIDWLENYKPDSPWSMYDRALCRVETADGLVAAWTYVAGPQVLARIRQGRLRKLEQGIWSLVR